MTDYENAEICRVCGSEGPTNHGRCEECNERDAYRVGKHIYARRKTEEEREDENE